MNKSSVLDNHVDDHVDEEIRLCLSGASPKCFFMFAGAGSGKTRSLVDALKFLKETRGEEYRRLGKSLSLPIQMQQVTKFKIASNMILSFMFLPYTVFYGC